MGDTTKPQTGNSAPRTARSQANFLKQRELNDTLAKVENHIQYANRKIAELEADKAWMVRDSIGQSGTSWSFQIARTQAILREQQDMVALYGEQRDHLNAEISALNPSPKQIAKRAEQQSVLAQLASERLEKDREAESILQQFKKILHERAELSAAMTERAESLEFDTAANDLDAARFNALLNSLPAELAATSESWNEHFLGTQKVKTRYIVRDDRLVIPETLPDHGVYHRGDSVELTAEEARELLRTDRTVLYRDTDTLGGPVPHRIPPSIMSVEDFEAATKLAEEKGVAIHDIFFWNDVDSDTLVTPGSRFSITIKSAGNIGSGGRIIPAGEILELPIKDVLPLVKMKVAVRPY